MASRWVGPGARALVAVILVGGCGRFGYDSISAGADVVDAGPGGIDDDTGVSDGAMAVADAGTPFVPGEQRLTTSAGRSLHPVVAWSGSSLFVVWDDSRRGNQDVYLSRLTATGDTAVREVRVTPDEAVGGFPAAAWAGDHLTIAWEDNRTGDTEIYLINRDATGAASGGEVQVTSNGINDFDPVLAWSGSELAIGYHAGNESKTVVHLRRIAADGGLLGRVADVSTGAALSQFTSLVWLGNAWGLVWQDNRDGAFAAYLRPVAVDGTPVGVDVRATSSGSRVAVPVLAWSGREHGLAWADSRVGRSVVYFTRLDAQGNRVGAEQPVSTGLSEARTPAMVWTGSQYAVVWSQDGGILLALLDAGGKVARGPVRISARGSAAAEPSIAWMNGQLGVAWHDGRHGEEEIYAAVVTP